MSSTYSKGALQRRFSTDTTNYTYFSTNTAITNVKFTQGDGVDGVTNTMAAAIWFVDFIMETVMYNIYDVHWDGNIYDGNYQAFFGPAPDFEPQPIYYAAIALGIFGH